MNKELSIEFVKNFYYEDLGFCGCGNPASILCVIKDFLNVIDAYSENKINYKEKERRLSLALLCDEAYGIEEVKVNWGTEQIILNVLNNCDVLEHGSGIGSSWLTLYGEEVLEHLNNLNYKDLEGEI